MQNVHRVPLACRRLFATYNSSRSWTKGDGSPKSAFAERFGNSAQTRPHDSQAPFPTWPGLQPPQTSTHVNPLTLRSPPQNLVSVAGEEQETSEGDVPTCAERRRAAKRTRKQKELFSDWIGNASGFVNTSSFEAKLALEPAATTYKQWKVVAQKNTKQLKSIPEPFEHELEMPSSPKCKESQPAPNNNSTTKPDEPAPNATSSLRTSRTPIVTPSGRRMLSTSASGISLTLFLAANQTICRAETRVVVKLSPQRTSSWNDGISWMSTSALDHRPYTQLSRCGFIGRICGWHRLCSNQPLSFFQPAPHPSLLTFARGYVTGRGPKRQMVPIREPKKGLKHSPNDPQKRPSQHSSHKGRLEKNRLGKNPLVETPLGEAPLGETSPEKPPRRKRAHRARKVYIRHYRTSFEPPTLDPDLPCILFPPPTTATELCSALRHLIQSNKPLLPISRLIVTHAQHSILQSCSSFNILLAYAVRVAPVPYSTRIIAQMRARGIAWDKDTERLAVRAHIQSGRWHEAIQLAEKLWVDGNVSRVPLDIFTELLHFVLTKKMTLGEIALMADRTWRLLPTGTSTDTVSESPQIAYNVLRLLVKTGRHEHAVQLARTLLSSLESPTLANTRYCRSILFHVIRPPRHEPHDGSRPPKFHQRRQLFESLLNHNPSLKLKPNARLTAALLENFFRSRNRGAAAFHVLLEMRAKYGPRVEDESVRRLIIRYSIKDGNLDLAREMFEREKLARLEKMRQSQSKPAGVPWAGEDPIRMQSHLEYVRKDGGRNLKWEMVARRLRRDELKAGLDGLNLTHPKTLLKAEKWVLSLEKMSPGRQRRKSLRVVTLRLRGNAKKREP